jgi:hypothetical protein
MSMLHALVERAGEGRTVIQLRCHEDAPRVELVVLREDVPCAQIECDLEEALAMLDSAHEMFRLRGHGLRVEILAPARPRPSRSTER